MSDDLKELKKEVNALNIIVNNGLRDSVRQIRKQVQWLMGMMITLIIAFVGSTITLLAVVL
jgi:hypothetical protein